MEKDIKSLTMNPFTKIGDEWMLITSEKDGKVNTMTASWGGMGVLWGKNVAFIFIRDSRYTKEFVDKSATFSLSVFDHKENLEMLSYMGKVSGRDEDKIAKCNLTVEHACDVPYFKEARENYICKKLYSLPLPLENFVPEEEKAILDRYYPTKDKHNLYIGEIIKVIEK